MVAVHLVLAAVLHSAAPPQPSQVWVAHSVDDLALPGVAVEPRGVYRDFALSLITTTSTMKTRTLDAPNRRTFLSAADPDATLFVVETNGAAELAKVLQDNTTAMKVVGSQGLSVVVAAAVWPDIDKALASIVVPVPTSAVRAAATPTGWRGPHIKRIQAKLASGLADPIICRSIGGCEAR